MHPCGVLDPAYPFFNPKGSLLSGYKIYIMNHPIAKKIQIVCLKALT